MTAKDRIDRIISILTEHTVGELGMLRDTPARIAQDIAPILVEHPGDTIYVVDYEPIIYSLVGIAPPTKYAFPPFLIQPALTYVAKADALKEVRAILAKRPLFIIRAASRPPGADNDAVYELLDNAINEGYEKSFSYPEAKVFRRRLDH